MATQAKTAFNDYVIRDLKLAAFGRKEIEIAEELKGKGVDEIACTAVNDAFVMGAWGKGAEAGDKVTMLSDGNGEFVKAIGLSMDASKHGMGTRGQRFSMIVNDGAVEQLNVEEPGAFNVSSADYMLERL